MAEENLDVPLQLSLKLDEDSDGPIKLADRWTRLTASIIDSIIELGFAGPAMLALGLWSYEGAQPPIGRLALYAVFGFLYFVAVHGYLLHKNGQTVGKNLFGIRIARPGGGVPGLGRLLLLRYLPIAVVALIPTVSFLGLVDVLFIFRSDRRCLHDLIAGTIVVNASRARR